MNLLIVNYHYFREETYSSGIYPTSKEFFRQQLKTLGQQYNFISQSDLLDAINGSAFPYADNCLITFDDGLKEQLDAFEVLKEMGIPAIFYAPTDPIEHSTVLDVHKLHYIRAHRDDRFLFDLLDHHFGISSFKYNEGALAIQYRYDEPLARKVKYYLNFELDEAQKESFLESAFAEIAGDESTYARHFYMDISDLRKLAQAGSLGSHGCSHRPLATLPLDEATADIQRSVQRLEAWTDVPIRSFAYPYGGATAVCPDLETAFKGTSVSFALSMQRGINDDSDLRTPYFLKRIDTNDAPGGKNAL
jgi:peptidoglycan/xylan/chitin deacetylase (PgdA/CDA1 family)